MFFMEKQPIHYLWTVAMPQKNNKKKVMKIIMSSIIKEAMAFLRDYFY